MIQNSKNLIVILGPTASGKTPFAARLAAQINGEIISADSRQVYRDMTLGTGKDLDDYVVDGLQIPYHLIDIVDAGEKYNVYRFQNDFFDAFNNIQQRCKTPIMCGGTGLYIEAVLKGYKMINVPPSPELRKSLETKTLPELTEILASFKKLHNTSDTDTIKRAIRGIEIEKYYAENPEIECNLPKINPIIIGLDISRDLRREKITRRLHTRLNAGMLDEVQTLLNRGIPADDLIYYGLEYKYLTLHLIGQLSYKEMICQLEIAIHQFAKRQMTWFRGMERRGFTIKWIDAALPMKDKLSIALKIIS